MTGTNPASDRAVVDELVRRTCAQQGLDEAVHDVATLDRIAVLVGSQDGGTERAMTDDAA